MVNGKRRLARRRQMLARGRQAARRASTLAGTSACTPAAGPMHFTPNDDPQRRRRLRGSNPSFLWQRQHRQTLAQSLCSFWRRALSHHLALPLSNVSSWRADTIDKRPASTSTWPQPFPNTTGITGPLLDQEPLAGGALLSRQGRRMCWSLTHPISENFKPGNPRLAFLWAAHADLHLCDADWPCSRATRSTHEFRLGICCAPSNNDSLTVVSRRNPASLRHAGAHLRPVAAPAVQLK